MTDAEMAAALRSRGWVCREPVEPKPQTDDKWHKAPNNFNKYMSDWARKTGARP